MGAGAGFPVGGDLLAVGRASLALLDYRRIAGGYQIWQLDLGLRMTVPPWGKVRPSLEAAASAQSGQRDRDRRTPIPDHLGFGAKLAVGAEVPVSEHFGAVAAAEAGRIWMVAGRVENGSWVRAESGVRTDSFRLRVEAAWHP